MPATNSSVHASDATKPRRSPRRARVRNASPAMRSTTLTGATATSDILQAGTGVGHAREIRRARPRIELAQQGVIERRTFGSADLARRIGEIPEADRARRARGLASRHDVAVGQRPSAGIGVAARRCDALYAKSTLFHHARAAHRDLRVVQ